MIKNSSDKKLTIEMAEMLFVAQNNWHAVRSGLGPKCPRGNRFNKGHKYIAEKA
jgi:hypothetical protein